MDIIYLNTTISKGVLMKKLILMLCLIMVTCTGCISISKISNDLTGEFDVNSIYSDNEKIAEDHSSYNMFQATQNISNTSYEAAFELEGMLKIWEYDAEANEKIDISYMLSTTTGKAKLVLIEPDAEVRTIIEDVSNITQTEMESSTFSLKEGKNIIKLVAYNQANLNFKVEINAGEFSRTIY